MLAANIAIASTQPPVRYTFRGVLKLEGALHIGSGNAGRVGDAQPATDATIVRDSLGRPYIPGSSLRGALRAAISQIAPLLLNKQDARLIDSEEEIKRLRTSAEQQVAIARERAETAGVDDFDTEGELQNRLDALLSPAERLFGTTLWASPLYIPDLHVEQTVLGEVRHGVGIDRDTGAAREKIKYDFEVLPKGYTFAFLMRCEIPSRYSETWGQMLAIGLRLLEQGEITLGGRTARGVGQVKLADLVVYRLVLDRANLLARLRAGEEARDGTKHDGWVQAQLDKLANQQ